MKTNEVDEYISKLPIPQQAICRNLNSLALSQMPGVHVMIYHGAIGYSTTPSGFDRIAYIAPQAKWVNLGFFFGTHLPDPHRILTGTGARMRHISIKNETEINPTILSELLNAAWKNAPFDIAGIHKKKRTENQSK